MKGAGAPYSNKRNENASISLSRVLVCYIKFNPHRVTFVQTRTPSNQVSINFDPIDLHILEFIDADFPSGCRCEISNLKPSKNLLNSEDTTLKHCNHDIAAMNIQFHRTCKFPFDDNSKEWQTHFWHSV